MKILKGTNQRVPNKDEAKKQIDPVTLEVIHRRLVSIADEMEAALLRSAFSIVVTEGRDATTALFDAKGQTLAQGLAVPMQLGALAIFIPIILKKYPVSQMCPGDVYIANDPYGGGTHIPDVTIMLPIFYRDEVVGLSCSMAHMQDFGAMTPGVPAASTSIFQEGLNLPPLKFYEAGKPNEALHAIIRNNVRMPDNILGDLNAQVVACNTGKTRVLELIDEYGKDTVLNAMQQILDYTERLTRQAIADIPDGAYTFEDYMDNDGVDLDKRIKIHVTITIQGPEMTVDFSGSNPQVKGPYNIPPSGAYTATAYVVKAVTNLDVPTNAGYFRSIKVLTPPEGTIVNPRAPAPVGARTATAARMVDTMLGALAQAIPERVIAASGGEPLVVCFGGFDPKTGKEFVGYDAGRCGLGARPTKDGVDVICTDVSNILNVPIEVMERDFPMQVVYTGLHNDSGGAGKFRGRLGLEKVFKILRGEDISVTFRGERHYTTPWGLFGGLPGANAKACIVRKSGNVEEIPSKRDFTMNAGDLLHVFTSGGGGYGDPLERDPSFVLQDVLDKKVSCRRAKEDYGVVIDLAAEAVDARETDNLRKAMGKKRGPINWTYQRERRGGRISF